eukprot:4680975-Lingulodinium_polyedra.AAC.1
MTTHPSSTPPRSNATGADRTFASQPNRTSMRLAGGAHTNCLRTRSTLPTNRGGRRKACRAPPFRRC